jgi:hypothetical protein
MHQKTKQPLCKLEIWGSGNLSSGKSPANDFRQAWQALPRDSGSCPAHSEKAVLMDFWAGNCKTQASPACGKRVIKSTDFWVNSSDTDAVINFASFVSSSRFFLT